MVAYRVQTVLKTDSTLPEDWITNSWAFTGTDPLADKTAVEAALKAFYDSLVSTVFSTNISQNAHLFKWYELPGPKPNYPVAETTWNLASNPTAISLPYEVSMVLSFQGQRVPGFPQARRRGRLYIGTIQATGVSYERPAAGQVTAIANAATTFKAAIEAIPSNTVWAVWSKSDQAGVQVNNGWVDNAWDTQRRRGNVPTSRTVWT